MGLAPDIGEARRFLDMLDPSGDFVFQTFDDRDTEEKDRKLARTTRNFDALARLNEKHAGVFMTVNAVEGDKRKADKVTRVRALFADFDGAEMPETWDLDPSCIVRSSPGKFHVYWFVDGDFPREEFSESQRAIAKYFSADPKVIDLPRVMRVPGFWHRKDGDHRVEIVDGDGERYPVRRLREWIDRISPAPEPEEPARPPQQRYSSLNGGTHPYVKAAVEKALASIASAGKGNRNTTLNSEAFGIFGLVKAGAVPESIRADIERAAESIGLPKAEITATLRSAWDASRAREIPQDRRYADVPHDPETGEIKEPEKKPVKKEKPIGLDLGGLPFRMLGHNKGTYFYLPKGGGQVVGLKAHEHTPLRLMAIAPLNYWYSARKNAEDGKITEYQWQQIANGLIQTQHEEGIFEESRLRGRGAWIDGRRAIVHTGNELIIDGQIAELGASGSRYVYEAAAPWEFGFGDPATTAEAHRLVDICERLTWDDVLSGPLLAGWCVVAPVSGALKWRPHIWISGPSGSGKSTAQNDIVGKVVGPASEKFDGKATEAAIRQLMGYDARPVIFDEAEGEDADSAKRMQQILDLARVSSSGGRIPKGSSNHIARTFIIRSCFCFSSIHASIRHHADESRITRLVLRKNIADDADAHYVGLMRDIETYFTPEFASRMFARTVANLPTLLKNCEIFTTAAAVAFRNRRAADQIGAMLAGLYLCHSTGEVTREAADGFIAKHHWADHVALDSAEDHARLFSYLMSRMMRVMTNDGPREMSMGQAIVDTAYARELGPRGVKVDGEIVWISNSADAIAEMLRDKPQWSSDWRRPLGLLPGAVKSEKAIYFAPGVISRAVGIPRGLLREV